MRFSRPAPRFTSVRSLSSPPLSEANVTSSPYAALYAASASGRYVSPESTVSTIGSMDGAGSTVTCPSPVIQAAAVVPFAPVAV